MLNSMPHVWTLPWYTNLHIPLSLKNFFKKNLGSVNILSLSLSLGLFRKDAAALPSQTWAGLRVRPPGFQGVHSHGAQCCWPLESYTSQLQCLPGGKPTVSVSSGRAQPRGLVCFPWRTWVELLNPLVWIISRKDFLVCWCWVQCSGAKVMWTSSATGESWEKARTDTTY